MLIKPYKYNGFEINDGTFFAAWIPDEANTVYNLAEASVSEARRMGGFPAYADFYLSGKKFTLMIKMLGNWSTMVSALQFIFDTRQGEKELVIFDEDGGQLWYMMCKVIGMPRIVGQTVAVKLGASDPIWRSVIKQSVKWEIDASGQKKEFTTLGNCEARPKITIKPISAKNNGFLYGKFIAVRTQIKSNGIYVSGDLSNWAVDITNGNFNTQALVNAGKMKANGDDLRVYVDGVEVDRWLDGINTTTTKVWIKLNLRHYQYDTNLVGAIGNQDNVTELVVDDDFWGRDQTPTSGIVMIDNEIFTYTGKDLGGVTKKLTGVKRAMKGSSAEAHADGAAVHLIEHDIWIYYGNATLGSPVLSTQNKPIFDLASSTNTIWDYNEFYDGDFPNRPGSWVYTKNDGDIYGGNHDSAVNPYEELGSKCVTTGNSYYVVEWLSPLTAYLIKEANFQNGEMYRDGVINRSVIGYLYKKDYSVDIDGIPTNLYSISKPTNDKTWEGWSKNNTNLSNCYRVCLNLYGDTSIGSVVKLECADVTLTLDSARTPVVNLAAGGEVASYQLACVIDNETTGEEIRLNYTMTPNETLEVDCEKQTVTYLQDGSNAAAALSLDAVRQEWLTLAAGTNTLAYYETGVDGVEINVEWEDRHL